MGSVYAYLPTHFRTGQDTFLRRLLTAVDEVDDEVLQFIEYASNQFNYTTSDGRYLLALAASSGLVLPRFSGVNVEAFRKLAPVATSMPKQALGSILSLLEIFYGAQVVRPSVVALNAEPYYVADGDEITLEVRAGLVPVRLDPGFFVDPLNVTASELASYINSRQSVVYADTVVNRNTGAVFLRLTAPGYGASEILAVRGGSFQNVVRVPKVRELTADDGTEWQITKSAAWSDEVRFTWTGNGQDPRTYLSRAGDVAVFRNIVDSSTSGSALFQDLDQYGRPLTTSTSRSTEPGNYSVLNNDGLTVIDAGLDYLVLRVPGLNTVNGLLVQRSRSDLTITSSEPSRIYDQSEYALVTQAIESTLSLVLPAVPPIIKRELRGSTHLRGRTAPVVSFSRTQVDLDLSLVPEDLPGDSVFYLESPAFEGAPQDGYYFGVSRVGDSLTVSTTDGLSLPFTTPSLVASDPVHPSSDGQFFDVDFGYSHGLRRGWGFTLSGVAAPYAFLNTEHSVSEVLSSTVVRVRPPQQFPGLFQLVESVDVQRIGVLRADLADLAFTPASTTPYLSLIGRTIEVRQVFPPAPSPTVSTVPAVANDVYGRQLQVVDVDVNLGRVFLRAGVGPGVDGTVIQAGRVYAVQPAIGGGSASYLFDSSTNLNSRIVEDMQAVVVSNVPAQTSAYQGAFLFDPEGQYQPFAVSGTHCLLDEDVIIGSNDRFIRVTDADGMPDSGTVCFSFGTEDVEGPITYSSKISVGGGVYQLVVDAANVFQRSHDAGASVNVLSAVSPVEPLSDGTSLQAYVTGIKSTRDVVILIAEKLVAAGVFVDADIQFPQLVFEDPSLRAYD